MAGVRVVARQRARLAASGPAHPTEIFAKLSCVWPLPESMQGTEPNDGQNFPPLVAGRRYRWGPFVAMRGRRRQGSSPCHFTPPWVAKGSDAYARVDQCEGLMGRRVPDVLISCGYRATAAALLRPANMKCAPPRSLARLETKQSELNEPALCLVPRTSRPASDGGDVLDGLPSIAVGGYWASHSHSNPTARSSSKAYSRGPETARLVARRRSNRVVRMPAPAGQATNPLRS
jgi:hypothetical protein